MSARQALLAGLLLLAVGDALACSPIPPPAPVAGESDADYRVRGWRERLSQPLFEHVFSARVTAVDRDTSTTPERIVLHLTDIHSYRGHRPPDGTVLITGCGNPPPTEGRILVAAIAGFITSGSLIWTDGREFQGLERALQDPSRMTSDDGR